MILHDTTWLSHPFSLRRHPLTSQDQMASSWICCIHVGYWGWSIGISNETSEGIPKLFILFSFENVVESANWRVISSMWEPYGILVWTLCLSPLGPCIFQISCWPSTINVYSPGMLPIVKESGKVTWWSWCQWQAKRLEDGIGCNWMQLFRNLWWQGSYGVHAWCFVWLDWVRIIVV